MASSGHDFQLKTKVLVGADTGDEVTLPCHLSPNISAVSMTIRWFKETKCIYVYKNGQVIEGRGYEDRLSLVTQELERGNVSLRLRDCRVTDVGVYICQVIHGEQEQETAVGLWTRIGLPTNSTIRPEVRHSDLFAVAVAGSHWAGPLDTTTSSTIRPEARHWAGPLDTTTSSTIRPEARHLERDLYSDSRIARLTDWLYVSHYLEKETVEEKLQRIRSAELLERADVSGHSPPPIRRRHSKESPPIMGAESPDPEFTLPLRRRRSKELDPPHMGAESSTPDSPVFPGVSELRLVLLGRTGAGRRAAGNILLDREEFGAQASPSAESQRSRRREGDVCGRRVVLVDTPDWFCPGFPLEEMRQDVGLCVRLSTPGPHAFLLVIPVDPSEEKEEERGMMERMEEMFGEGCWGHTVILFTHADSLTQQSIKDFLRAGSPDLQQLVEKCGNRYHVLNIKDRAQGTQVSELLDQIEEMVSGNTGSFYSTQIYLESAK